MANRYYRLFQFGYYRRFQFGTKKEAEAFKQGVEYANDSALAVLGVKKTKNGWAVILQDKDKEHE